ncbi:prolyl oligopeptidase family serine peptidase [bacterium]|nr:prolyl oligopeptidase family serine peptidase [bacterium]
MISRYPLILLGCFLSVSLASVQAQLQLRGNATVVREITTLVDLATNATYHVTRAVRPPVIDGNADEWGDLPAMVLDKKDQGRGVRGPDDLSGSLRMLWTPAALYFCLEVTDDVHRAPNSEEDFWENDSIQFAFDPHLNGPVGGYDADELSLCLSDTPNGPLLSTFQLPSQDIRKEAVVTRENIAVAVRPDGVRVYEWSMPWTTLAPVSPWIIGRTGFSFTLNDDDGKGFEGALFWTPGIIWGQDASKFGQLVFDGAVGTQDARLGLRAEPRLLDDTPVGNWLDLDGVPSFNTARVLVCRTTPGPVEAILKVYRPGQRQPVAVGRAQHDLAAGQTVAFAWELAGLADGPYELAYEVPSIRDKPGPRLPCCQLDVSAFRARARELRDRFGIDRPWDDLSDASPLIRRHRGMIATLLQWLHQHNSLSLVRNADASSEHLQAVSECLAMIDALDRGRDYLGAQRNEFWSAYYSAADGSGQHFVTTVPANFSPRKTYPLVVDLHGRGGRPLPDRNAVHREPFIEVDPWGRGDNGYTGLGENDVLEIIDYMKQWYRIDPNRVYVTGGSMGGGGTWRMAVRHPDLFAAAAPVYGWADDPRLENLRNVPVFNQHGQLDWTVSIDLSRYAVNKLQQLGYAVVHKEYPEAGHGISNQYPVRDWMRTFQRSPSPAAITYTCESPDDGRAYWLTIHQVADPHATATVTARATGRGDQQSLTLLLRNVAVLELDLEQMPVDRRAALLVQIGETFLEHPAPLPARLYVIRESDRWSMLPEWSAPTSTTRVYRVGAAANLYDGEPLLIVYGTGGSPQRIAILRTAAEKLAAFAGAGDPMVLGRIPTKPDTEVTPEDLDHFNVILLGSATRNQVTKQLWNKLPFTVNDQRRLVAGDRDPVSIDGAGIRLSYYNPLSPQRLIFLVATDVADEAAGRWYTNVTELLTGSAGWQSVDAADLVVQTIGGGDRRRMQFTRDWQWRAVAGADHPLPAAMADPRATTLAVLKIIQQTAGTDFAFLWAPKPGQKDLDPAWFTLADLAIERRPQPILVGRVTGEELIEIHAKSLSTDKLLALPAVQPKDIDPTRLYTVAMPPHVAWELKTRQQNLRDVAAGPEWRPEDVWREVFGQ